MSALKYVGFRSPVTLHEQGTVSAWEAKRMSKIIATKMSTREVRFLLESGEYVMVPPENICYELWTAVDPRAAFATTAADSDKGNVVPKAKA